MNMEEKLELNHIKHYLGTGVKFRRFMGDKKFIDLPLTPNNIIWIQDGKLLLHPLDRLTEPILEGGETPIDWLQEKYYTLKLDAQCKRVLEDERWINQCDWLLIQHFAEWHIDFQGLIEKGLALPIDPK